MYFLVRNSSSYNTLGVASFGIRIGIIDEIIIEVSFPLSSVCVNILYNVYFSGRDDSSRDSCSSSNNRKRYTKNAEKHSQPSFDKLVQLTINIIREKKKILLTPVYRGSLYRWTLECIGLMQRSNK